MTDQKKPSPASSDAPILADAAVAVDVSEQLGVGRTRRSSPRTALVIMLAVGCAMAFVCWIQWRSLQSNENALHVQTAALSSMRNDVQRIRSLRETPQQATDRRRPNDELLAQVEKAIRSAGVAQDLWQDSIPQPAQREANSSYQRLTTRLYFEGITLQQLTGFAHALLKADTTLFLSSVRISADRNQEGQQNTWNADLAVSYLIFSPSAG